MTPFPDAFFFDLDGTLVDSAPDIRTCLFEALRECEIETHGMIERFKIGPPLDAMIRLMDPDITEARLVSVVASFRKRYDQSAYPLTVPFAGVESLLSILKSSGFPLYVATNKPSCPSKRIVDKLGWHFFEAILTPDSFPGSRCNKAQLLQRITAERRYNPRNCLMVGDLPEDVEAARTAGFSSVVVSWGYGNANDLAQCGADWLVSEPAQVMAIRKESTDV